ncbi:hypothetical protein [Aureimonas glaciei]|nr:hypothetical protein [Aureimonas glaciei]
MRLPGRRYEGASLFDLGSIHARAVLEGTLPYHEWMLRQIDERLPTPASLRRDDYDPEEIEAHLASGENEEGLAEVEAILEAFPGSRVTDVRRSGPVLVVDNAPTPAAPEAPERTSGVSPIKKLPPVVYDGDDDDDFAA